MNQEPDLKPDFGTFLQETYKPKTDTDIHLTDSFPMFQLIILPGMRGSFTTYINEKCASFDFEKDILFVFLEILEKMGICNKNQAISEFEADPTSPFQIDFLKTPILLTGVVLSCRLGKQTSSTVTGEPFVPIIIRTIKIAQEPAAEFFPL